MLALINARILTVSNGIVENGGILINDGKIISVGDIKIPEGCDVTDCTGKWVTPGFIEAHSHISAMNEPNTMPSMHDLNERTSPITPQLRAKDLFNPHETSIAEARKGGFTAACVLPGSSNVIGGTGFAVKLNNANCVDKMAIPGTECMKMALGENPRHTFGGSGKMPSTRMGIAAILRETLIKARNYSERKEKNSDTPFDFKMEALLPAIRGEMQVRIHAHRADDIVTAIRISREFSLKYSIEHCTEGYKIIDILRQDDPFCVVGPLLRITGAGAKMEVWDGRMDNAAILLDSGLPVCLTEDAASSTKWLPFHIGIIMDRSTLTEAQALKAVTLAPAQLLGISSRTGSIEPGKDADLAVFTGSPFANTTVCTQTIIDGEVYSN